AGYPDPPHHRSPGPTNTEEEEEQRRPAPVPSKPGESAIFDVPFAFDVGDHLFARNSRVVSQTANFFRDSSASRVEVIGYRSAAVLSNGEQLVERDHIAQRRAEMVGKMLVHAGVPETAIEITTRDATGEADGVDDHLLR